MHHIVNLLEKLTVYRLVEPDRDLNDQSEQVSVHHAELFAGIGGDCKELRPVQKRRNGQRALVEESEGLIESFGVLVAKLECIRIGQGGLMS